MELEGKVALVTGAGSGIGQAIAQAMADAGAAVCINWFRDCGDERAMRDSGRGGSTYYVDGGMTRFAGPV